MTDESKLFEQVVAHLLRAQHDVKIKCKGSSKPRQFDGYREEISEDLETVTKIAIECKRWQYKVPIDRVESFSTKLRVCGIKYGYIVSFNGFQKGAIELASELDIRLFEFRPCTDDDVTKDTKAVQFDPVAPSNWRARLNIFSKTLPTDSETEKINDSMKSIYDVIIFDEDAKEIGIVGKIVEDFIDREIIEYGRKAGEHTIDWSTKNYQIQPYLLDRSLGVTSLEIEYELPIKQIIPMVSDNWYIMRDVITNSTRLIPVSKIKKIESKYQSRDI